MTAILSWVEPLAGLLVIALAYWWLLGKLLGPMVPKNRQRPDWRTTPEERARVDKALSYVNQNFRNH